MVVVARKSIASALKAIYFSSCMRKMGERSCTENPQYCKDKNDEHDPRLTNQKAFHLGI